jgi:phage FluMu protein Com
MPIRFRCAYCNQLLGIAHRKAGTVVRCPTCAGQVVVPDPNTANVEKPAPQPAGAPLFERSDFDELFGPIERQKEPLDKKDRVVTAASLPELALPAPPPAPPPRTVAGPSDYDVEKLSVVSAPSFANRSLVAHGILLSPAKATFLTVAVIIALVLSFSAGLLVGLLLRSTG